MKKLLFRLCLLVMLPAAVLSSSAFAQTGYSSQKDLTDRLRQLDRSGGDLTDLRSLAKSPDGNDVWLLTIGSGDVTQKPAIAVIGGTEGTDILGSELALGFAEQILNNTTLLETTTFYVLPRINPDAAQQYFENLKFERAGNGTSTDDDRDGSFDEDGFEDLNDDGVITMMRVEDPTGKWMVSTEDERVLVEADAAKGDKGSYLLFSEGRDNDDDGKFNEDGDGGVNINQNFTFDFPYFQPGSGENMASQPETIALLDFLFEEARNTFAVVSFGPENNLSSPLRFNRGAVSKRVIDGWYEDDIAINKLVSDAYNEAISQEDAPDGDPRQGDLFQWAYFHYGRFSFSTPGWWVPAVEDTAGKPMKFDEADAHYLAWIEQEGIDGFVEWAEIDHPDFPGKKVEVGGIKPYSHVPPFELVEDLVTEHTTFISKLAEMKPSIKLENFKTESAGRNLTRITVDVYNEGLIPTASHVGTRTDWVRDIIIDVSTSESLHLVSGTKRTYEESIGGDESVSYTWLVRGSGDFTIKAGAPQSGFATFTETIK
jgi:hypothetical protein